MATTFDKPERGNPGSHIAFAQPGASMRSLLAAVLCLCAMHLLAASDAGSVPETPATRETPAYDATLIHDLLLAEIAGQRGRWDITLLNYLKQAQHTRDPGVIQRAALIASYLRAHHAASDMALLWAEVEPDNADAAMFAATQMLRIGRHFEALEFLAQLLTQHPDYPLEEFAQTTRALSPESRDQLIHALDERAADYRRNAAFWFLLAELRDQNGDIEGAIDACNRTIHLDRDHIDAKILKGQLRLAQDDDIGKVTRYFARVYREHRDDKRAGIIYARMLAQSGELDKAAEQYKKLANRFSEDPELVMSVALIALENQMDDDAELWLHKTIATGYRSAEAYTWLGRLLARQHRYEEAIEAYSNVHGGPHFIAARLQIALLLSEQGLHSEALEEIANLRKLSPSNIEQLYMVESEIRARSTDYAGALAVLNEGLGIFADSANLLYARAMLADRTGDIAQTESDLRIILAQNPNNPVALNALGYTLADKTDRYEEALGYISQAIALQPDDPAVIDSMGWVQYRLGNHSLALEYLRRAYNLFPDHEVSAHLGEVLWVTGKREEARRVWERALQDHPDSVILQRVVSEFID